MKEKDIIELIEAATITYFATDIYGESLDETVPDAVKFVENVFHYEGYKINPQMTEEIVWQVVAEYHNLFVLSHRINKAIFEYFAELKTYKKYKFIKKDLHKYVHNFLKTDEAIDTYFTEDLNNLLSSKNDDIFNYYNLLRA